MPCPRTIAAAGFALILGGCMAAAAPAAQDQAVTRMDVVSGSADAGRMLARAQCASCHTVEGSDASPLKAAPPFRELGAFYPASDLQEAFAEGVVTAHPAMPEFQFTPQEIADLIAYLDSISGSPSNSPP